MSESVHEIARTILAGGAFRDEDAVRLAEAFLTGTEPAWQGVYPGMCVDPEVCRGRSACPRDYSCCE